MRWTPVGLGPALQAIAPSRNVRTTIARAALSRRRRVMSRPTVAPGTRPEMAGNPCTAGRGVPDGRSCAVRLGFTRTPSKRGMHAPPNGPDRQVHACPGPPDLPAPPLHFGGGVGNADPRFGGGALRRVPAPGGRGHAG